MIIRNSAFELFVEKVFLLSLDWIRYILHTRIQSLILYPLNLTLIESEISYVRNLTSSLFFAATFRFGGRVTIVTYLSSSGRCHVVFAVSTTVRIFGCFDHVLDFFLPMSNDLTFGNIVVRQFIRVELRT